MSVPEAGDPQGGSQVDSLAEAESPAQSEGEPTLVCDFCGRAAPSVRRVALDGDYERLRTPHAVRYACQSCSERKEKERRERRPTSGS